VAWQLKGNSGIGGNGSANSARGSGWFDGDRIVIFTTFAGYMVHDGTIPTATHVWGITTLDEYASESTFFLEGGEWRRCMILVVTDHIITSSDTTFPVAISSGFSELVTRTDGHANAYKQSAMWVFGNQDIVAKAPAYHRMYSVHAAPAGWFEVEATASGHNMHFQAIRTLTTAEAYPNVAGDWVL
jgi:hypothetical protein